MAKVSITQGDLVGAKFLTPNKTEYYGFCEIPYAEPPVGELRFKPPRPPQKWEGVRDATRFESVTMAAQSGWSIEGPTPSEDCLYLNVYTPTLSTKQDDLLPVIVFFHAGAFTYLSGTDKKIVGPDFLVEQNVIFVSLNFRLGYFGFLNLGIPEASGNMGLKDQVMALRWIQENISFFGGDKNNVSLFGLSSGSASIEYHILSPLSKGLFHKAIMSSGSCLNHWAINYKIKDLSIQVAQDMGYQGPDNDMKKIHRFLLDQPTEIFYESITKVREANVKGFSFLFVPTVEEDFKSGEEFITKTPYKILQEGTFNKVLVLRGFNEREGLNMFAYHDQPLNDLVEKKNYTDFWEYPLEPNDCLSYNSRFDELYRKKSKYEHPDDFAIKFFGDFDFISGVVKSSKMMVQKGVAQYNYIFHYDGNFSLLKKLYQITRKGSCHVDDGYYILGPINFLSKGNDIDILIRKRMTTMWANFARYGDPTPTTSELLPTRWPRFDIEDQKVMIINENFQIESLKEISKTTALHEEIYNKYQK